MSRKFFVNVIFVVSFLFGTMYGCGVLEKFDENQNLNEDITAEQFVQNENLQKQEVIVKEELSKESIFVKDVFDAGNQDQKIPDNITDSNQNELVVDNFNTEKTVTEEQQETNIFDNVIPVGKLKVTPLKTQKNGSNPYYYLAGEKGKVLMSYSFTAIDEDIEIKQITFYFESLDINTNGVSTLIRPLQIKKDGNDFGHQFYILNKQTAVYNGTAFVIKKGTKVIIEVIIMVPDANILQSGTIIMPGIACVTKLDNTCWNKVGSYAIDAVGMSSMSKIQIINDTGDSTGKTFSASEYIRFADSYLEVSLNINSPSGKISSGLNVEVARFNLKNIGTTTITVNNMFFKVDDTNPLACKMVKQGDANVETVDESRSFWTCDSIVLFSTFDWKTCKFPIKQYSLTISPNTTLTVKFKGAVGSCNAGTYLNFELEKIQYSDGDGEFRIPTLLAKGNQLEF